ncbi:MAG: UDP-galactose-4-epimerase [Methanobacterium sp. PtaU1.Bin242]|nr:MAG: UDP-galactose-4-epimerase [Methanobacterium sp. PtaU1.Bin242]
MVDNQSTGKIENIDHLNLDNIEVVMGDITEIDLVEVFEGCDYVLHQAALPSVPRSIKDPLASNEANITGTLKVLLAARDSEVLKVTFASSSSVYGDTPTLPKVETMPLNPQSPYAVTKATGELYCQNFTDIYDLPTVCLRYFNVFGPRQDPNSQYAAVIPKFITSIIHDQPPVIFGDGKQSRDFTYVSNVVEANLLAAESKETGVFNVACGRRIILNNLAMMLGEIIGKEVEPVYVDPRPGDIKHSLADISKAESFGFRPASDFEDELEETVRFFNGLEL